MKKTIVLTGKFIKKIEAVKQLLEEGGFEVSNSLDNKTQILLVGDGEKSYWATSETGNLIHKATRFNNHGSDVEIFFEKEFFDNFSPKITSIQTHV